MSIASPQDGAEIAADPETPRAQATVALQAVVDPPVPQVVWYVDGEPFEVVDYPYATRWPLSPGEHAFEARVADARSPRVRVRISM